MTIDDPQPDDSLDPSMLEAARAYHEPPPTVPRETMWAAIERQRRDLSRVPTHRGAPRSWISRRLLQPWVLSAAAVVVLATGIALGWAVHGGTKTDRGPVPEARVATTETRGNGAAYDIALTRNLTQVEALLAAYHAAPDSKAVADLQLASWARDLLSNTRLLLDSPVGADPKRHRLLEDLELVLAQMVQLPSDTASVNRAMIDQTLDRNHLLLRLRVAVPAGGSGT